MLNRLWWTLLACTLGIAQAATPDIVLNDLHGKPRNVNEFIGKGKWVVVVFWAHDCRVCEKEIHQMNTFHQAHQDKDAIVVGVTIDGMARLQLAQQFAARHQLQFPNLVIEPEEEAVLRFGGGKFLGTPTHYFYEPRGRIVGRKIGPISGADVEEFIEAFNNSPYAKGQGAK